LKIRCKNCANVITVREGMTADDEPGGRGRHTTQAPLSTVGQPIAASAGGALGAAFAEQLAKPPPALEEEWYVSIDGQQEGPFGLAAAQRWVAAKPFDAELHCWSEGFDDWLPVDKVSHFRGLRKRPLPVAAPLPAAPPPMPRPREPEPKPLFAATMAALEKPAAAPAPAPLGLLTKSPSAQVPAITKSPSAQVPAIPTNGVTAKANGTGPAIVPRATLPSPTSPKTNGTGPSAAQAALAAAFDVSSAPEVSPGIEAEPFKDVRARPGAAKQPVPIHNDEDDDMEIGEVSRVVNLADIARSSAAQKAQKATAAQARVTGPRPAIAGVAAVGRATASAPRLDLAQLGIDATASVDALPPMPEGLAAAPVVAQAHRRGLIMLIGVAALLLAGVTVAVVLMLSRDSADDSSSSLGPTAQAIDMSRPDEVVRAHMAPAPPENPANPAQRPHHPQFQQPHGNSGALMPETPDATGAHLKPEEIEEMAQKNSSATQRCYMRAQRGEMGLELGDLKKITVTLDVDKTGAVNSVQLSEHGADSLGMCLTNQIKRWKFRESAGGQFRIALAFAGN